MAPMFHAAGVYSALVLPWIGATNVIVPAFDPDAVLDVIADEAITCAIAVPTMLAALVERQSADPRDVSSLRWLSHGASPVAIEVLRRAADAVRLRAHPPLRGDRAVAAGDRLPPRGAAPRRPRAKSCGQPAPGVDLDIVDADGRPVAGGDVGEVVVRGPNVMAGYWNKPDRLRPPCSTAGGTARVISATSTRTATCTSSTGPRT